MVPAKQKQGRYSYANSKDRHRGRESREKGGDKSYFVVRLSSVLGKQDFYTPVSHSP
jgi:hypothetical protein